MPKARISIVIIMLVAFVAGQPVIEPDPEPVEVKPTVTKQFREWYMYDKLISREYEVMMPDGSNLWIKCKDKAGLTNKELQNKADAIWEVKQNEAKIELFTIAWDSANEPDYCPFCRQVLPGDFEP